MAILIEAPQHPATLPAKAAVESLIAAATRIGRTGMTLDDLKTLHTYRDAALNYDQHLAEHEGRESEVSLADSANAVADELARIRNSDAVEERESQEELVPPLSISAIQFPFGDEDISHHRLSVCL